MSEAEDSNFRTIAAEDGTAVFTFHSRKKKMTEEERLLRCRERNRIHAKNTRERKKEQSELLEMKIAELSAAVRYVTVNPLFK